MTLNQFLTKLRKTPRRWELVTEWGDVRVRQQRTGRCPLEVVAGVKRGRWEEAAYKLGLPDKACESILRAADIASIRNHLRLRLLAACGLTEAR